MQSAAVTVADSTPGRAARPDGVTVNIHICEHPTPVAELRRVYDTISQTLGYRTLEQYAGRDVWQLKLILHVLGYYRPGQETLEGSDRPDAFLYTQDVVEAVDAFRAAHGLSTPAAGSPPGLVDRATVEKLWVALEKAGKAESIRGRIREITAVRR